MKTATKNTFFVNNLVPMWHAMRSTLATPKILAPIAADRGFKVKRAGRPVSLSEYQQQGKSNQTRGGGSYVAIQFGFLGGFGGFRLLGESPG